MLEDLPKKKEKDLVLMIAKGGDLIWEVKHSIHKDPKVVCPLCGAKAERTLMGTPVPIAYIRGDGYLDRKGCRRDMDLYKLNQNQDPYGYMRQPGEVDHLKDKLRRGGKRGFDSDGNRTRKIFTS